MIIFLYTNYKNMDSYSKDVLKSVLQTFNDKPPSSANKTQLINRLKNVVCDGKVPTKECPPGKVLNPKTGRCINEKKAKLPVKSKSPVKSQSPVKSKSPVKSQSPVKPKSPVKSQSPVKPKSEKADKPSKKTFDKWFDVFLPIFDEGNSGCLRYTGINISFNGVTADTVTTFKLDPKDKIIHVDVDGELEHVQFSSKSTPRILDTIRYYSEDNSSNSESNYNNSASNSDKSESDAIYGAIQDIMYKLWDISNKDVKIQITSAPNESACGADEGTYGKDILRDAFGAFLNECCGIPKENIIIYEVDWETDKKKRIKW